jgi:hypothetical protein
VNSIECNIIEGSSGDFLILGDGTDKYSLTCTIDPEKKDANSLAWFFKTDGKQININKGRVYRFGRDIEWESVKNYRNRQEIEKPLGEWNRMEILSKDKEIIVWLNGVMVNKAVNVNPVKGSIQVQSEGAEIIFRKIELTLL